MEERILEEIETIFEHINYDIKMGIKEHDLHMHTDIATGLKLLEFIKMRRDIYQSDIFHVFKVKIVKEKSTFFAYLICKIPFLIDQNLP
jgi:hypothetical protein